MLSNDLIFGRSIGNTENVFVGIDLRCSGWNTNSVIHFLTNIPWLIGAQRGYIKRANAAMMAEILAVILSTPLELFQRVVPTRGKNSIHKMPCKQAIYHS